MPQDGRRFDVVIVGGGIGGLTLACALARRNHSVGTLDARTGIPKTKRGVALLPNGIQALDRLGLLRLAEQKAVRIRQIKYYSGSGELLVSYDYDRLIHPHNHILSVHADELEASVRTRALDLGVKLFEGTVLEEFLYESNRVRGVRARTGGEANEFHSDVVVGADGSMSKVRELAGMRSEVKRYSHTYLTTTLNTPLDYREEARHFLARGKMLAIFPVEGGAYLIYHSQSLGDGRTAKDLDDFRKGISMLAPELKESVERLSSWEDLMGFRPLRVRVSPWVGDRVALMGDAAHVLEPSLGQGLNLALEDAAVLESVLHESFGKGDLSANALRSYELARRGYTDTLQSVADLVSKVMNTNNGIIERVRNRALRRAQTNESLNLLSMRIASGTIRQLGFIQKLRLGGFM